MLSWLVWMKKLNNPICGKNALGFLLNHEYCIFSKLFYFKVDLFIGFLFSIKAEWPKFKF